MADIESAQTDLLFDRPAATDANLLFGADFVAPRHDLTIMAALPLPAAAIRFIPPARAELLAELPRPCVRSLVLRPSVPLTEGASLPGVVFTGEVRYDSRTQRPTVGQTAHSWQQAAQREDGAAQRQQDARATPAGWGAAWQRAGASPHGIAHRLPPNLVAAPLLRRTDQQRATRLHGATGFVHENATPIAQSRTGLFQNATRLRDSKRFRHQDGDRSKRAGRVSIWQVARLLGQRQGSDFQSATPAPKGWCGRYQDAVPPPPGISVWVIPEPPTPQPCYTPSAHLLFAALAPADSHLLFLCKNHPDLPPPDGEPVVVPVRRVYFVINNVTLHRLPDGAPVPVFNLSLSLDIASWTWGFEAQLPAKAESLIAPANVSGQASGPVELVASINGIEFRVFAEDVSRERSFGDASIRISGRGRNAVLAAPYAPVMTFRNAEARTARQLMDDVLTLNGIPLGWTVDWGLTDWNVPAGAFAQQGTWIEALTTIAGAAGGYLLPHPSEQRIRVRHRYPVAPWEWHTVTPDFVLPVDAVARESLRWIEKPAYNRVFVSGQDVGVLGQVTRAGTAGDVLAPMVVDALITEAAAARQRGITVLADTGHQIEVRLRLPVLAETGIIEPGAFVEYQDGSVTRLGLVRSTQVEAGMPEVWQTLGVQGYA